MVSQGRIQFLTEEANHYQFREPFLQFHNASSPEIASRGDICYMTRNMMIQGQGFVQPTLWGLGRCGARGGIGGVGDDSFQGHDPGCGIGHKAETAYLG
jgi:hypothetical protein